MQPSLKHMLAPHTVTACNVLCCEKCCAVLPPGVCCGWVPLLKTSCPRMQQVRTAFLRGAAVQYMCAELHQSGVMA